MHTKEELTVQRELFLLQDVSYREFHTRLVPTVEKEKFIGVRTPALRIFAKKYAKTTEAERFLTTLPHEYVEENNLHAFLIETEKEFQKAIEKTETFLPYINNWATCDMFSPKVFKKHPGELYERIKLWLQSSHTYTVRYGIVQLLTHFLGDHFSTEHLHLVAAIKSEEYYINMAIAWYFSMALVKQYQKTIPYFTTPTLAPRVHNKALQKAVESQQLDEKTKQYLKTLKVLLR